MIFLVFLNDSFQSFMRPMKPNNCFSLCFRCFNDRLMA